MGSLCFLSSVLGDDGVCTYDLLCDRKKETEKIVWKKTHSIIYKELRNCKQTSEKRGIAMPKKQMDKNMILYGPPGTGKTYYTMIYAVAIIENKTVEELEAEALAEVKKRYEGYKQQGRIEFTTFHQSYGYEEFIEGIRPVMEEENEEKSELQYRVEPGIFKAFCDTAICPVTVQGQEEIGLNNAPVVWKVSLEQTGDNPTREECMHNNHIRIGWDSYGPEITDETNFVHGGINVLNAFINKMKVGDIVLSCYSASTIDAIGVVTGEYEWRSDYEKYKRVRPVKWLAKGLRYNIVEKNNGRNMTLSSVYKLNVTMSDVKSILKEIQGDTQDNSHVEMSSDSQNYVFIIDEINRGNISKIFGELITLVEPAKRLGQEEAMQARLPYSRKLFGIPDNVYLIGTMNTADRSIALLDTALRRRFQFVEMQPNPSVLHGIAVAGVDIEKMLTVLNQRVGVLCDREHTIGHAYFMSLGKNPSMEQLATIFQNRILPLLQEYFYEDYEKIRFVLGDNRKPESEQFLRKSRIDVLELFGDTDVPLEEEYSFDINVDAFWNPESYQKIYYYET